MGGSRCRDCGLEHWNHNDWAQCISELRTEVWRKDNKIATLTKRLARAGRWERSARKWWGELDDLRSTAALLCSYLGHGQPTLVTTADEYDSRIREGIDFMIRVETSRREAAEQKLADATERVQYLEGVVATRDVSVEQAIRERKDYNTMVEILRPLWESVAAFAATCTKPPGDAYATSAMRLIVAVFNETKANIEAIPEDRRRGLQ